MINEQQRQCAYICKSKKRSPHSHFELFWTLPFYDRPRNWWFRLFVRQAGRQANVRFLCAPIIIPGPPRARARTTRPPSYSLLQTSPPLVSQWHCVTILRRKIHHMSIPEPRGQLKPSSAREGDVGKAKKRAKLAKEWGSIQIFMGAN